MNVPRIRMAAIVSFAVGEFVIDEGDVLLLTHAEAAALMARGLVAPVGAFVDPALIHHAPDALQ